MRGRGAALLEGAAPAAALGRVGVLALLHRAPHGWTEMVPRGLAVADQAGRQRARDGATYEAEASDTRTR